MYLIPTQSADDGGGTGNRRHPTVFSCIGAKCDMPFCKECAAHIVPHMLPLMIDILVMLCVCIVYTGVGYLYVQYT